MPPQCHTHTSPPHPTLTIPAGARGLGLTPRKAAPAAGLTPRKAAAAGHGLAPADKENVGPAVV